MKWIKKTVVDYPIFLTTGESYRRLAKQLRMDAGRLHKVLNGTIVVSEKVASLLLAKLERIRRRG